MYTLFELDEHYPGTRLYEVTDTTDPDFPEKHMAVSFRYRLLDEFLKEWQLRKKHPTIPAQPINLFRPRDIKISICTISV